ncbi:MAG: hypothetical protein ACLPJH_00205 [Myxococcaceae bacterium]
MTRWAPTPTTGGWPLAAQHDHLKALSWTWKSYRKPRPEWDHDHCEFCWAKFMEPGTAETLGEGYASPDEYHWVCRPCFDDFREMFGWTSLGGPRL